MWDERQPVTVTREQKNLQLWKMLTSSAVKTVIENTSLCSTAISKEQSRVIRECPLSPSTNPNLVCSHSIRSQYNDGLRIFYSSQENAKVINEWGCDWRKNSTHEEMRNVRRIWIWEETGRDSLEDIGVDARISIKPDVMLQIHVRAQ
jgi:hypothetical protein